MGEPIRILHAIGSLNIGGSQAYIMNLYRNINRSQVQFDFVIEHPGELYHKGEIESLGGRVFELQPFRGFNLLAYHRQWRELLYSHPEWRVLHSHVRSTASLYFPIAHRRGIVTAIHSHSTAEARGFDGIAKRVLELPLRHQADCLFACSTESALFLYGRGAVKSGRVNVLPNSIDCSRYVFDFEVRERVRHELGVDGCVVYGHVGRYSEAKNHHFLLEAFTSIVNRNPNSRLLLVGDGELWGQVESDIERLGISKSVKMLGSRSDVPNLLQAFDIFLLPSVREGFPVAVIEAQAAGLPCYISNRITPEACITDLVHLLPITSIGPWETIEPRFRAYSDRVDELKAAGFDVTQSADWLTSFYLNLACRSDLACGEGETSLHEKH